MACEVKADPADPADPVDPSEVCSELWQDILSWNVHWLLVVYSGLYMHLRDLSWLKPILCDLGPLPFDPSYSTLIFMFSLLCLVAEYSLYPESLRIPPNCFFIFYKIAMVAFIKDAALRIFWIPMMYCIWTLTQNSSKLLLNICSAFDLRGDSWLYRVADYMGTQTAATHVAFALSVLIYLWMLDATESIDLLLKDFWALLSQILKITFHTTIFLLVAKVLMTYLNNVKSILKSPSISDEDC